MRETMKYAAASADIAADENLGTVVLRGVITRQTLSRMILDLGNVAAQADLRAFVVDLRGAALAMPLDGLRSLLHDREPGHPSFQPIAMIATGESLAILRAHSLRMVELGYLRIATSSAERAREWARAQVDFTRLRGRLAVMSEIRLNFDLRRADRDAANTEGLVRRTRSLEF